MKARFFGCLFPMFLFLAGSVSAQTGLISFDFASFGSSVISFDGQSHLTFAPDSTNLHDFQISSNAAGLASGLAGLYGDISDPTNSAGNPSKYTIGQITSVSGIQSAPMSGGKGTFSIFDASGNALTAKIWWVGALTYGTLGGLNPDGTMNLSGFSYSGNNTALQALAAQGAGTSVVSFQFTQATTLTQLATTSMTTSFSGSFSAGSTVNVPEPSTYAAILGMVALTGAALRRRRAT